MTDQTTNEPPGAAATDPAAPPKATVFTASRAELTGDTELTGAAEAARRAVTGAEQRWSLLHATAHTVHRIDGWFAGPSLVVHGVTEPTTPIAGSLGPTGAAEVTVAQLVAGLVGTLPTRRGAADVELALDTARPPTTWLPDGASWLLVASAESGGEVRRYALTDVDGLHGGHLDVGSTPNRLAPVGTVAGWTRLMLTLAARP